MTEWINANDRKPDDFVSVQCYMQNEAPLPTVHEGYYAPDNQWHIVGYMYGTSDVTFWTPMATPPKEDNDD